MLIQTFQSTLVWQDAATADVSRLWSGTHRVSTVAFCMPQHVVCSCFVPSFEVGLCPCGLLVCQLLYPQISSVLNCQALAYIYCFQIKRYCHLWSARGPDGKSSQHHKSDFIQSSSELQFNLHFKKIKAKAQKLPQDQLECKLGTYQLLLGSCPNIYLYPRVNVKTFIFFGRASHQQHIYEPML